MKSVTEFANFNLNQGLKAKIALTAEGKSAEEISQSLGETFKMEGDRLKHFVHALDLASQNSENLKRVIVMSLAEGEKAPARSVQVEEFHYVPEFHVDLKQQAAARAAKAEANPKGKGRGKGGPPRGEQKPARPATVASRPTPKAQA
jgi:hypothetical protein